MQPTPSTHKEQPVVPAQDGLPAEAAQGLTRGDGTTPRRAWGAGPTIQTAAGADTQYGPGTRAPDGAYIPTGS